MLRWVNFGRRSGLQVGQYCTPIHTYATRHTFALWSLVHRIHPEKLVALMGHGSRRMVYDVYGKYVEGILADAALIRDYFGEDYG